MGPSEPAGSVCLVQTTSVSFGSEGPSLKLQINPEPGQLNPELWESWETFWNNPSCLVLVLLGPTRQSQPGVFKGGASEPVQPVVVLCVCMYKHELFCSGSRRWRVAAAQRKQTEAPKWLPTCQDGCQKHAHTETLPEGRSLAFGVIVTENIKMCQRLKT